MKLITRKGLAAAASDRWLRQYFKSGTWQYGADKETIYRKLQALGETPAPEDVNKIIGNDSWTEICCDECGEKVEEVVQLGEELDYESSTANICKFCLISAMEEFVK
jgi:hypothetical protein